MPLTQSLYHDNGKQVPSDKFFRYFDKIILPSIILPMVLGGQLVEQGIMVFAPFEGLPEASRSTGGASLLMFNN